MKKNKYIIIGLITLIICIAGFLLLNPKKYHSQTFFIQDELVTKTEVKNEAQLISNSTEGDKEIEQIRVLLIAEDQSYPIQINEGASVCDVMKVAQETGFSFGGDEYPSLGFFVEEINGVKGGNGKYWMYYVNDKEAEVGISKYIIKDGDIINWRLK